MPSAVLVPPSGQLPLSSALPPGTGHADLDKTGYVEEEYHLSGIAPTITAAGDVVAQAPYVIRFLIRKPSDPSRFNGTVVIEPFSWSGTERQDGS